MVTRNREERKCGASLLHEPLVMPSSWYSYPGVIFSHKNSKGQSSMMVITACDFWGSVIKGFAASPRPLRPLTLGEASHHDMRKLKQPCGEAQEKSWDLLPIAPICQPHEGATWKDFPTLVKPSNDYSPGQSLGP